MPGFEVDAPGTTQLLMGNEAIARGALEAGIGFASSYPGTPSSEIMGSLAPVAKKMGFYAEWSVNEAVAIEAAAGASFSGVRSITSMKQNGRSVVTDFVATLVLTGLGKAGMVLVVCDDPQAHSSGNEDDTRNMAKWFDIPMVEPGNYQEAKEMTKWLFDLSEELDSLCLLRSVTRISHSRGNVKLDELPKKKPKAYFDEAHNIWNPRQSKFVQNPPPVKHAEQHQRLAKAQAIFEKSPFNWYAGPAKADLLIITAGSGWLHTQEVVKKLNLEKKVGILKLGTLWPMPEKFVTKYLAKSSKILFVEEVDPFIERNVMELVANMAPDSPRPTFYGKRSKHIPDTGELTPDIIIKAITGILDIKYQSRDAKYAKKAEKLAKALVPVRSLALCPGCPHRATLWSVKTALKLDGRNGVTTGDAGCYAMGTGATGYFQVRENHCMGGSCGIATGLGSLAQYGFDQPVVALCGDSSFFHANIPAFINGIWNDSNYTLLILDNNATSMTGFQPHPGVGANAMDDSAKKISIEALCRSLGARVEVCDPFDLKKTTGTLLEMMADNKGSKVLISRRECQLVKAKKEKAKYKVHVDETKCVGESCGCDRLCTRVFRCPGLTWDKKAGKSKINTVLCAGCGVCVDVCPQGAIVKEVA
ncbi:MAG: thiamine pyrophosphate-dependent enzyme [Dehalococcoidales bacterium]|nr:thiamine pyrophosphate-dependent enzyme [Dehalococcoidales bacterium]